MKALCTLLMLLSFAAYSEQMNTHSLFENTLELPLTVELKPLSNSTLEKRYANQKIPPAYAFSNKNNNVSFTLTRYQTPADKNNMRKIHKSISAMLRQANSKAKWKKDKVYTRLDTKVAVFEYETKGIGKYQYNITYALPVNNQLTLISFVTTDSKYKKKWVELARKSLDSLKLVTP